LVVGLAVGVVVAVAASLAFSHVVEGQRGCSCNDTAAESNLQTALTGANMYYTQHGGSFAGLDPLSFAAIGTGLSGVFSGYSDGPHAVSIAAGHGFVVMTTFKLGVGVCEGIVDDPAGALVLGSRAPRLYFDEPGAADTACDAARFAGAGRPRGLPASTAGWGALPSA
jgi:hypothetical protein